MVRAETDGSEHGPVLTVAAQIEKLLAGDASERYYAAWWLGRVRAQESVTALIDALGYAEDRTPTGAYPVRRNAARALGKLQDPEAIPALSQSLQTGDALLSAAVVQALGAIAQDHPEHQVAVGQRLLQELPPLQAIDPAAAPVDGLLESLIESLGDLKYLAAVDTVTSYQQHPSVRVRCAAARAGYRLTQDPACVEPLLVVLQDENIHLRRAALLDLGASGYLQGANAIAAAPVETNIKLLALKALLDGHLPQDPIPAAVLPVLAMLDDLI
ncbi:MAG: HEAT repeat domain-containing protein [Synechococcaceae cyanobacterium SM2_3_1]|nr:HEAT repeat domain-containing protein [Synechococcaceae cyanobacterium SM2_3_1]